MFSVITPTFNRAHTLFRVYNSLINQTDYSFEWIVIDDASTDETEILIDKWSKTKPPFEIIYTKLKKNKGKPNALNVGLELCSKEITIIADSDDEFLPITIEQLKKLWTGVNLTENSNKIATIWTLVRDENQQLVGDEFPKNYWQVNLEQRILKNKNITRGEKWHSWRTDVLKKYKMYHNENSFISESATWNRINADYDFLCLNIYHRKYFSSPDGYIMRKKNRLEIEKLKFYNSFYELENILIKNIFKYNYYHSYAFDYVKASTIYKDKDLKLNTIKYFSCCLLFLYHLPKRLKSFIKLKYTG